MSEAEALLAGRVPPSVRRVMEVIHAVNPTGRALSAGESARRYGLKGRLQSLLIERFGDELVVRVEPAEPGVVSLNHRSMPLDACHAVPGSLTEAARSWVQFQLDTQADEDAGETSALAASGLSTPRVAPTSHMNLGRAALDAYDYEAARVHFTAALAYAGTRAAVALLELDVDHLAADAEALALEETLAPATLAHPRVRGLLAVAAARTHDHERVRRLLHDVEHPHAAEAWVLLARNEIRDGTIENVRVALAEAQRLAPGHPALAEIVDALEARVASQRRALETVARDLLAGGALNEAEGAAHDVLTRWGDSAAAREVLRAVRERRRAMEADALRARIGTELDAGTVDVAERLLQALHLLGERDPVLAERVALAQRVARDAAAEALAVRILGVLHNDPVQGMREWLRADDGVRARVRQRTESDGERWLTVCAEALARGADADESLVAAVLAIDRAEGLFEADDPEGALDELSRHAAALEGVSRAKAVRRDARQKITHRQMRAWSGTVAQIENALDHADPKAARAAIEAEREAIPAELRARVEELRERLEHAEDRARREALVDLLVGREAWLEAREAVEALMEAHPTCDPEGRWKARRAELNDAVSRSFGLRVWRREDGSPEDSRYDAMMLTAVIAQGRAAELHLVEEGLVYVNWLGLFLVIRGYDPSDLSPAWRVVLRLPTHLDPLAACVHDGVLWLASKEGSLLGVDLRDPAIKACRPMRRVVALRGKTRCVQFFAGRFLWLDSVRDPDFYSVIDVESQQVLRKVRLRSPIPLYGHSSAMLTTVVAAGEGNALRLLDLRGEAQGQMPLHDGSAVPALDVHPDRQRIVVLETMGYAVRDGTSALQIYVTSPGGTLGPRLCLLPDVRAELLNVVTSLRHGMVFVQATERHGPRWLIALSVHDVTFDECWRIVVPESFALVSDRSGLQPMGVYASREGPRAILLGPQAPSDTSETLELTRLRLDCQKLGLCCTHDCRNDMVTATSAELKRKGITPRQWLSTLVKTQHIELASEGILAMTRLGHPYALQEGIASLRERASTDPMVRLLSASAYLADGAIDKVITTLTAGEPTGLTPPREAHWWHVLGTAYLRKGETSAAWGAWSRGVALKVPECAMQGLCDALAPEIPSATDDGHEHSLVQRVRAIVQATDDHLARGDVAAARATIACTDVLASLDLQSLARWAKVLLATTPATQGDFCMKVEVLAMVHGSCKVEHAIRFVVDLPYPGQAWDADTLGELSAQCQQWLTSAWPPEGDPY